MAGLFISFEGIDGVGKSTQANLLESFLREKGRDVVRTFEPGGTELGREIRELLLHRKGHVAPRAEALLYAADRSHHVSTLVRPALEAGKVVVTDRYLDSSVAYQGAGRALSEEEIRNLSLWATSNLLPDLTILLDLDSAAASQRRATTGEAPDRLESEKLEFFEAVRQSFLRMAEAEPKRFLVINADQSVEQMQAEIRSRVSELL
ncbi:MAG: dTMP kinase [Micrococcales bacterium]